MKTVPFGLVDIKSKLHSHDQLIADLQQALLVQGREIERLKKRIYYNEQAEVR